MADIQSNQSSTPLFKGRQRFGTKEHVQHAQLMLLAAGLSAFGIVAVAGAMLTTLF